MLNPGAVAAEQMAFARLRATADLRAQLKELKLQLEKQVQLHAKRPGLHRLDRMALADITVFRPLFYHAIQTGEGYEDDGGDTFLASESWLFTAANYKHLASLTRETEPLDRKLFVRWGSADAGTVGNLELWLEGSLSRKLPGLKGPPFSLIYRSGQYFDDLAWETEKQLLGFNSVVKELKLADSITTRIVSKIPVPVFTADVKPEKTLFENLRAHVKSEGYEYRIYLPECFSLGKLGKKNECDVSTENLASTAEGLKLFERILKSATKVLGSPSDVTLQYEILSGELAELSKLRDRNRVYSIVGSYLPFRRGFRPLAEGVSFSGSVQVYPLLLLNRYKDSCAPLCPSLAVNAVHAADGLWIELQTSGRPDLIDLAAKVFKSKPEHWKGDPSIRWGWYGKPGASKASKSKPASSRLANSKSTNSKPASSKSTNSKSTNPKSTSSKSASSKSINSKSTSSKSTSSKPASSKSASSKSTSSKPTKTKTSHQKTSPRKSRS